MVQKGIFWTIGEWSYIGLLSYYILSKSKDLLDENNVYEKIMLEQWGQCKIQS